MTTMKTCVICGAAFQARGRVLTCSITCNREQIKERKRLYRETHREQISQQERTYRDAHCEQICRKDRAYREANRESRREQARERSRLQRLAYKVLKHFPGVLTPTNTEE